MQKPLPLVTVIVPIYNVEKYVRACLNSIVNQTYQHLQIICVDDCSPDKSMDIVKEYAAHDGRIRIIRHEKNQGLSAARNSGLDIAEGEFVTFIDSDDELSHSFAYEKAISHFTDDVDAVCYGTDVIFEIDDPTQQNDFQQYFFGHANGKTILTDDLLLKYNVCMPNKMFRMSIIRQFNIRFPIGLLFEDNVFYWNYFSVIKNAFFITEKLYKYYRRGQSIMTSAFDQKESYWVHNIYLLDKIIEFWSKHRLLEKRTNTFLQICSSYSIGAYLRAPNFERPWIIWELSQRLRKWDFDCKEFPFLEKVKSGDFLIDFSHPALNDLTEPPAQTASVAPSRPIKKPRKRRGLEKILFVGNEGDRKVVRLFSLKIFSKKRKSKKGS